MKHERMTEIGTWHEQDCFWETVAPILFSERRLSNAPSEVDRIISLLGLKPGMHILDLACGVGRHSLEFARRGFRVTGVDRMRAYLEEASRQAKGRGLNIEFIEDDMRDFCRPATFDAAVNLFTSFGYFEDPEDDCRVVRNVAQSLNRDGVFLIEMQGKELLARDFRRREWRDEDGTLILEERKLGKCWDRLDSRWILLRGDERIEHRLSLRLYSAVELRSLLTECSFTQVDVYGDLAGHPYDQTAKRLVAVAHK
jgi:SAM-dependent methyltransferase